MCDVFLSHRTFVIFSDSLRFTLKVIIDLGMTDDLDDLLGGAPIFPPRKKRGRPTNAERAARLEAQAASGETELPDWQTFYQPVTAAFLGKVFRKETKTVLKFLRDCPVAVLKPSTTRGLPVPHYDFVEAASYLVPPKVDLLKYIKSLNSNSIPAWLNKTVWDAENAKLKWLENSLSLWRDEDVLDVLGTTAISIRERTMLWVDELPDKTDISNANYLALRAQVAELLEQIKNDLIELPKQRRTTSLAHKMDEILGDSRPDASLFDDPETLLLDDEE